MIFNAARATVAQHDKLATLLAPARSQGRWKDRGQPASALNGLSSPFRRNG